MKIAIIGAGFAALSLAWHLKPHAELQLFEADSSSTSSLAAGLLHKFGGQYARKSPEADLALQKSLQLITSFGPDLVTPIPLYRRPLSEAQKIECENRALEFPNELSFDGDLHIHEAFRIDCGTYIARMKAHFNIEKKKIDDLLTLSGFDAICVAAGDGTLALLPEDWRARFSITRGQLAILKNESRLNRALMGKVYLLPDDSKGELVVGATYERGKLWMDAAPFLEMGARELLGETFSLEGAKILRGARVTTPSRLPIIGQVSDGIYVFAGLGSKGLLYHGLYGERLASLIRK